MGPSTMQSKRIPGMKYNQNTTTYLNEYCSWCCTGDEARMAQFIFSSGNSNQKNLKLAVIEKSKIASPIPFNIVEVEFHRIQNGCALFSWK